MFGCNALFDDLNDLVEQLDGSIYRIILNIEPEDKPRRISYKDRLKRTGRKIEIGKLSNFKPRSHERYLIGFPGLKIKPLITIINKKHNLCFDNLTHPSCTIQTKNVSIGEGTIILAGVIVASYVKIGKFVRINRGATIGHDTELGDYSNIQPGVNIASNVKVGKGAIICLGANIIEDVVIGSNSIVAAGAVVLEDVPANCMVAGVPAKFKKKL